MQKSIIIIGGGIAGLAAGCYGQMNGYQTQIFELHHLPGGLCTAWERKGYTFDGCIHYLLGSGEGQPFNQIWHELGVLPGTHFINHRELMRVRAAEGQELVGYVDPDALQTHLTQLSSSDTRRIKGLADAIRLFTRFDMSIQQAKPRSLMTPEDWGDFGLHMAPFMGALAKWARLSAQDFSAGFKDPFVQRALPVIFGWPEIPMMAGIALLASMHTDNAGFPAGASLEFARTIERRYLALGGQIHYRAQVERILVENGRAVGVKLYNDEEYRADHVISAADGRSTLFEMLGDKYVPPKLKRLYAAALPLYSQVQISLGVDRDLSAEPHWVTYLLDQPLVIMNEEHYEIGVKNYCYDPSLAPEGKSCLVVMFKSRYGYWQRIYGRALYDSEQSQVSDTVLDFLERLYPGIRAQVEVIDEATPLSYERFTGNWQGSSVGWLLTTKTMQMNIKGMDKILPGLDNFYMAGQWVEPGGMVPVVAMSGRNAIQLVCAADRREFEAVV
ncbi:MAG TPA: NAD(P)/FAD-dependent oxidoreductase [Anaerolineales bacterium]|nr:NAD(P)/FAD-dependent oxidoreductase [Anaerolineales bacterium]